MGDQFSLGLRCTVSPDLRKTTFGPRVYSLQRIAGFQLPPSKADALPNLPRAFQGRGGTETRPAQGDDRGQSKHLTGGVVTINPGVVTNVKEVSVSFGGQNSVFVFRVEAFLLSGKLCLAGYKHHRGEFLHEMGQLICCSYGASAVKQTKKKVPQIKHN